MMKNQEFKNRFNVHILKPGSGHYDEDVGHESWEEIFDGLDVVYPEYAEDKASVQGRGRKCGSVRTEHVYHGVPGALGQPVLQPVEPEIEREEEPVVLQLDIWILGLERIES